MLKYVVVSGLEIFLFPPHVSHEEHLRRLGVGKEGCTGAGFVDDDWKCCGESAGMGIGRGIIDQTLLNIARGKREL